MPLLRNFKVFAREIQIVQHNLNELQSQQAFAASLAVSEKNPTQYNFEMNVFKTTF